METKKFIYYQDEDMLIGWLEDFPDYRTQGETLDELKENLNDIYAGLTSGSIPNVRHAEELRGNGRRILQQLFPSHGI